MTRLAAIMVTLLCLVFPTGIAYGACNSNVAVDQELDQAIATSAGVSAGNPAECRQDAGFVRTAATSTRQYDPTAGRFLSVDPMDLWNELDIEDPYVSAYIYANNRPGVLTDPSGMIPEGGYTQESAAKAMRLVMMAGATATACRLLVVAVAVPGVNLAALACAARAMAYIWAAYAVLQAAPVVADAVQAGADRVMDRVTEDDQPSCRRATDLPEVETSVMFAKKGSQRGKGNVSGTPSPRDKEELDKKRRGEPYDKKAANRAAEWEKRNAKHKGDRHSRHSGEGC